MNVSAMMDELSDHGFTDATDERKLAVLNDAYYDICGRQPWNFLENTIDFTFDGTNAYPSNWASLAGAGMRAVLNAQVDGLNSGGQISHIRYDDLLMRENAELTLTSSRPLNFYFVWAAGQLQLRFWPVPTAQTTITCWYIARPPALTDVTTEAQIWLPPEYHRSTIVNGAIYRLDAMEDDTDLAAAFQGYYEQAIARMAEFMWKQQYDKPDVIHPVDIDDMGGTGLFDISTYSGG